MGAGAGEGAGAGVSVAASVAEGGTAGGFLGGRPRFFAGGATGAMGTTDATVALSDIAGGTVRVLVGTWIKFWAERPKMNYRAILYREIQILAGSE